MHPPISARFLKNLQVFHQQNTDICIQTDRGTNEKKEKAVYPSKYPDGCFFLAANFIFLLIASALYYQWAFHILLEDGEKLHIQSMQQSKHRIEQTLEEADKAVSLLIYGNIGQKTLAHSGDKTDIDSILLYRSYSEQVSGILCSYSSIYSIYFYTSDNLLIGSSPLHTCINDDPASIPSLLKYAGKNNSWGIIGGLREDFFNPLFNKDEVNPRLLTMIRRSPVFHSGVIYGYIIVNFQEDRFYDAFQAELPGEELLLLTSDGNDHFRKQKKPDWRIRYRFSGS